MEIIGGDGKALDCVEILIIASGDAIVQKHEVKRAEARYRIFMARMRIAWRVLFVWGSVQTIYSLWRIFK